MKILFFIDSLIAGGKERRLTELMKELDKMPDVDFSLVVMDDKIHYKEIFNFKINIHYLIRKQKRDFSILKKFYQICKQYQPDFIHCWDSMTAIYAIPTAVLLKIKLINGLVVDTPVQKNIFNKHWLRAQISFPFSKIIIGNSYAGLAAYKASKKKSYCVYNGMDLNRFHNLKDAVNFKKEIIGQQFSQDVFIVGMVAAFEDRKDYKTLIKAAISIISKKPNVKFVLVGEGKNLEEIKKLVPNPLSGSFFFLGKRHDVESIINIFDIGVLLTNTKIHGEGISNSIIEYMALGKAVIATKGGGTSEVITDEINGFLIESGNDQQLVEIVEKLMLDNSLRTELGRKAKELAEKRFDLKIMTNNYIKIYDSLLQKRKSK